MVLDQVILTVFLKEVTSMSEVKGYYVQNLLSGTVTHYNSQRHIINKTGLSAKQVQALCKGQTVKGFHLYGFKD